MKSVLCLLATLSVFQSLAQPRTATVSAYCRSLCLYPAAAYNTSGGTYTLGFTTPDSASQPLYSLLPGGRVFSSGELRPLANRSGLYETDFFLLLNNSLQQYGTVSLSIPTQDRDHNGIPDLIEVAKPFYGSATNSPLETTTNSFYLRFARDPGSVTGTYSGMMVRPNGNFSVLDGQFDLSLLQGQVTYLRQRQNQLQWELTRTGEINIPLLLTNTAICTSNSLRGSVVYQAGGPGEISLPQFVLTNILQVVHPEVAYTTNYYVTNAVAGTNEVTLTNAVTVTNFFNVTNELTLGLCTVRATTLKLSGTRYVGNIRLLDGSLTTTWADYKDWVMEIQDPNDADANGTPDLSDPTAVDIPRSSFSLTVNGAGTVSPALDGQLLEIGRTYKLAAQPAVGCLFSNWTGGIETNTPTLSFVMRSNLALQANFVPNLFYPARGTYRGLISGTNGLAPETAGYITAVTTDAAHYSARVQLGGRSYSFSGAFDAAGRTSRSFAGPGGSTLFLDLQLDLSGANLLLGTVSDGTWTAGITAKKSPFHSTRVPCPFAGKYTLAIAPLMPEETLILTNALALAAQTENSGPAGYGYGTVTVAANGQVKLIGSLADGSPIAQTTALSAEAEWPLYASLYRGRGCLQGLLTLTNPASIGTLAWLKPASLADKYYPAGFTNQAPFTLAPYHPPTAAVPVLNWTNGSIFFGGGNLPSWLENQILLRTNDYKFANAGTNQLTLGFTRATGLFRGNITRPDTGQRLAFKGVLLQPLLGYGYFLGTNLSGQVILGQPGLPQPPSPNTAAAPAPGHY